MANTKTDIYTPNSTSGSQPFSDQIAEGAERLRDQAAEVGEQAMKAVDTGRQRAASGLNSAADKLHQTADRLPGGPSVSRAAHKTADGLGATANYIGENSFGDMLGDVGEFVKAHPTQALIAALAVGFLVGRGMRRG